MKLSPFLIVPAIAWLIAPLAVAGQGMGMERGQKARPDPGGAPQYVPVMIAQVSQAQQSAAKVDRTFGYCQMISNPATPSKSNQNLIGPVSVMRGYFSAFEHKVLKEGATSVTVLASPIHGTLEDLGTLAYDQNGNVTRDTGERKYRYRAETGYVGQDSVIFLVEKDGYKVKVVMYLHVFGYQIQDDIPLMEENCPNGESLWKISAAPYTDVAKIAATGQLVTWLKAAQLGSNLAANI